MAEPLKDVLLIKPQRIPNSYSLRFCQLQVCMCSFVCNVVLKAFGTCIPGVEWRGFVCKALHKVILLCLSP